LNRHTLGIRLRLDGRRGQAAFDKNLLVIEALEGEPIVIQSAPR